MKLRNKKTGEIVDFQSFRFYQTDSCKFPSEIYESLSALNEEWEDYKPKEPLIKDEKIRKAVRAWAEATGTKSVNYWGHIESRQNGSSIEFQNGLGLEHGDDYTIEELCGESEE